MDSTATQNESPATRDALIDIASRLGRNAGELQWRTPSHVYNPLAYAWDAQREYLERYGGKRGRVLLLGMNPGPWGMAQTGVPFGDIGAVRDWFQLEFELTGPLPEQHPKYPILGMACHRRERSGERIWGWARQRFGAPGRFFEHFFVWNYCPLLFLGDNRNLTPERLKKAEKDALVRVCDRALEQVAGALEPAAVASIGRYAQGRAQALFGESRPIAYLPHPSPANPTANRRWPEMAEDALAPWLPPQ
jgi:single-strand selective monofunctional uracil DNA glycosylase